ncbi:MAG: sigma-70 family RNA polymerase sigma factor [Aquabacterium sp.]|nr:MAG: sigma-70 family RNA polymerase sigma factor [Aquabacterium sp.]
MTSTPVAPQELSPEARELAERHMPLVHRIAAVLFRDRSFHGIPFEEFVQFGMQGLLQAAMRFDASRGFSFETYASHRIRGAILSGLDISTEVNLQVAARRRLLAERVGSLAAPAEDDAPAQPSPEGALGRLVQVSIGLAIAFMLDDTTMYEAEGVHHWDDGSANLAYRQLQRRLRGALDKLNEQERRVVEGHYFLHEAFEDIAAAMALSKGRISQIHKKALQRLHAELASLRLADFVA